MKLFSITMALVIIVLLALLVTGVDHSGRYQFVNTLGTKGNGILIDSRTGAITSCRDGSGYVRDWENKGTVQNHWATVCDIIAD